MKRRLPGLSLLRWQYVLPRALVALGVVLAVRYGLDPCLRSALVASGESAIGAKVEVGELVTSLSEGEIVVTDFAAANPKKPLRNLFQAERMRLHFDADQLLRKRVVVRSGQISGLQFDSERSASGALEVAGDADASGPSIFDPVVSAAQERTLAWLDEVGGRVEQDLMAAFLTPRVLQDLEQRWPQQYAVLRERGDQLRSQGKEIEEQFREVKKNPLRNAPLIEELQTKLKHTQTRLKETLAEIAGLPDQAKADRAAVDAARKQDEQFIREHLKLSEVDGAELSQYLLGQEAAGYLSQTMWWIKKVREFIPETKIARPARLPGTNVLFVDRRQPKYLLERVEVAGIASLDGQELAFVGELTDATTEPSLHARPLRLSLRGSGAATCTATIEVDRRGAIPRDQIVLDCSELQLAPRTLGKAERLAVMLAPGEGALRADVKLDGDVITGVIEIRQASAVTATSPMLRDERLAKVLHESLRGIDRVEAAVYLSGTTAKPDFKIQASLGPQLATAFNGAVRAYLTERKDRLVAKVQGRVDEQLSKLDAARQKAKGELLAKLGEDQKLLGQLAPLLAGKPSLENVPVPQIGKAFEKLKR